MRLLMLLGAVALAGPAWGACKTDFLEVQDWSIRPVTAETNEISYTIKANTDKPIRMIDASIAFKDALGARIGSMAVERDAVIKAGSTYSTSGRWGLNTFERMLKLKKDEVEATTCVRAVLYEDGSKEQF